MKRLIPILLFLLIAPWIGWGQSWHQVHNVKRTEIDIHWFTSSPFIYRDADGRLAGVEYEMMNEFKDYLKRRYQVNVTLNWIESESFHGIMESIESASDVDAFGVSAFSITEERQEKFRFSSSYFPDITVLVSSKGTPVVMNYDEFNRMITGMEAVTIRGTNYEQMLQNIRTEMKLPFEINYIQSDQNILDHVAQAPDRFGFIDLPIYLMLVKEGGALTRQNLFTVRGTGYGILMPKQSDWHVPFNNFLSDPVYSERIGQIISKYIGAELFEFIDKIYGDDQISTSILTKEKELQLAQIQNANLQLQKEQTLRRVLIIGMTVVFAFFLVIGGLFFQNRRKTNLLVEQHRHINEQQKQLIIRNKRLVELNEEKNNLVKILAHDLRSPLSQIIMIADLMGKTKTKLSDEDVDLLDRIGKSAGHLNQLIAKVLDTDVLEGNSMKVLQEQIEIYPLLHELRVRFKPLASSKKIALNIQTDEALPVLHSDHLLLTQVLENLLSNAIKFSPAQTTVSLQVQAKLRSVIFSISDQGPGFTEEDKVHLFDRFHKLTAQPTGGESSLGLGLSIVKKYVTDLRGEVWLDSVPGEGSTFYVKIPVWTPRP